MRKRLSIVIAGAGCLLMAFAVPVFAHHAFSAEYDSTKPVTLKGTVKKMEWINPHSWMTLEVKTDEGKVETWEVETSTPFGRRLMQEDDSENHRNDADGDVDVEDQLPTGIGDEIATKCWANGWSQQGGDTKETHGCATFVWWKFAEDQGERQGE